MSPAISVMRKPLTKPFYHYKYFKKYGSDELLLCSVCNYKIEQYNLLKNTHKKSLLFITEPIKNFNKITEDYYYVYKSFIENDFDIITGCINHHPENNRFKLPLYLFENNFNMDNKSAVIDINKSVQDISQQQLNSKKFCTLINAWDPANVRTVIYNRLKNIQLIECPGKLFKNIPNKKINSIGKARFINQFKFNICCENYDYNNIPGYITEKLMDCCLGGAIPIYAGDGFDEYDAKIFNKDRILFYNSKDENSINQVHDKVIDMMTNRFKLFEFYQQPVFCNTAFDTIQELKNALDCKAKSGGTATWGDKFIQRLMRRN